MSKVTFSLTYEELLVRKRGRYEQKVIIDPDQVASIPDYQIVVNVDESSNLTFVHVPSLSNDINTGDDQADNPDVIIQRPASNRAIVTWSPTTTAQMKLAFEGSLGNFLVQYDVDRKADAGQILLMQGYFVHFFFPVSLPPLRKHVIFVLDISFSMQGKKLQQVQESQNKILDDLSPDDYFNIITFSTGVYQWSPHDHGSRNKQQQPFPAKPQNVNAAKMFVSSLRAEAATNIYGALAEALSLTATIKDAQQKATSQPLPLSTSDDKSEYFDNSILLLNRAGFKVEAPASTPTPTTAGEKVQVLPLNVQSLIIFLTDGEPTVGIWNPTEILNKIRSTNQNLSIPIYSLGFGEGADFSFLKKLSLQDDGFTRKIYEASDATLQMEGFYSEISSPLLSNVTFIYTSDEYMVNEITSTRFSTAFAGGEIAVSGKLVRQRRATKARSYSIFNEIANEKSIPIGCGFEQLENGNFGVNVGGVFREGTVTLNRVELFKVPCAIDYDLFFPPPHSPHKTVFRTPPPANIEDNFLERLWAYLTISQLIEKESSGVDDNAFTSKERALQLALRYGFVTPLTNLVVVRPNDSSEVTNTVPMDARSRVVDISLGTSQPSYPPSTVPAPTVPTNPVPQQPHGITESHESTYPPYQPTYADHTHHSEHDSTFHGYSSSGDGAFGRGDDDEDSPPIVSEYGEGDDDTQPSPTIFSSQLTLDQIKWLLSKKYFITLGNWRYCISRNSKSEGNAGYKCSNPTTGKKGRCVHLEKCVLSAFLNDQKMYTNSYFCKLLVPSGRGSILHAAVCCPLITYV